MKREIFALIHLEYLGDSALKSIRQCIKIYLGPFNMALQANSRLGY